MVSIVDAAIKYESVDKFADREKIMAYIIKNIERYIGARKSRYERLYGRQLCSTHKNMASHTKSDVSAGKKTQQSLNYNTNRSASGPATCCHNCWLRVRIVLSTICFWTGKRLGNYLVVLYMFVKTLWLTNAVSQLFLLNRFIGNDYHAFGIEIIQMLLSGQEWHELRHFPRVTYCDFKIREIGNQHDWTVQCVLRINLFNEVIYIFMWFWLCILALCSMLDYITWTFRLLIPGVKLQFVKRHLDVYNTYTPSNQGHLGDNQQARTSGSSSKEKSQHQQQADFEYIDVQREKKLMREFAFNYLKDDGIFAMRILASNASDLIVTEIMSELWKNFKHSYYESSDEFTYLSSHLSSSSGSSQQSSAATSAASSPSAVLANNQLNKQPPFGPLSATQSSANNNSIKKPLNYNYPTQVQQQQQQKQASFSPNNNQQMPPGNPIYSSSFNKPQPQQQQQQQQQASSQLPQLPLPPPVQACSTALSNPTSNFNRTSSPINLQHPQPISSLSPLAPSHQQQPHPSSLNQTQSNTLDEKKTHSSNLTTGNNNNSMFPQLQQRHLHHHEHSNVNPNSKDTHV
jgi:hypothetical protein